ncbi:MAG TPA: sigma-70 family RNA polymerase sigma factor [Gemmatimonadaceae bacterium]|nr:sigma-70 family RNA polymerase sigma factor [Gemmatimonadaceae bacterium]
MDRSDTDPGLLDREHAEVALAAAGDRRAFERLYRTHVDRVYSICVRMVNDRGRAEELTQDVFVRAWEKLSQFRGESAFGTWLHRLAVNFVLNERKAERRRQDRLTDVEDLDDVSEGKAQRDWSPAIAVDLEAAIQLLPPGAKQVFILHDVEGFTHEEIGQMLGVTSGGTKAQLHRARLLLRKALQR